MLFRSGIGTGEGIASNRTTPGANSSTNQYGLDFYTEFQVRMQIYNNGEVHIMGPLFANGKQLA